MSLQQLDRWLMNAVFDRSRVFRIELQYCRDEFGSYFGPDGNHFFVEALRQGEDFRTVFNYLKEYYQTHPILSFNDVVGHDIGSPAGAQYFCPWEKDRIRPLEKFLGSHKVGPTSDKALEKIVLRLLRVVEVIRKEGFRQYSIWDGFARVIEIKDRGNNNPQFLIRDGQHRAAALSYLGYTSILATYDADFWTPSPVYRFGSRLSDFFRSPRNEDTTRKAPKVISEEDVSQWPHVREGCVSEQEALTFFKAVFGQPNELRRERRDG